MEALIIVIVFIVIMAIVVTYAALSWGYVCFKLWYWFLLPVFPTLPSVTFWQCVGLMFFISLFKNHSSNSIKEEFTDESKVFISVAIGPWLTLLVAYFFKDVI